MAEISTRRACGGCTSCCFTHDVSTSDELFKEPNEWCTHCAVGHGCGIYENGRLLVCKNWQCAWLEGMGTESERPDKTRVVIDWKYTRFGKTFVMAGTTPEALFSDYARRLTVEHAKRRIPVLHAHTDGRKQLVFTEGAVLKTSTRQNAERQGIEIVFVSTEP